MTTDPGDLVLDPTCGSGTTAFVAEQWGRRWITIDTSRVAVALARQRLLTSKFDYYELTREDKGPHGGFKNNTVPYVTFRDIAQNKALDPIIARWEPVLTEKLAALNAALATVTPALRAKLQAKLADKERTQGKSAMTDADRRRWLLPKERWQEWEVPFDTDPDWPEALQAALDGLPESLARQDGRGKRRPSRRARPRKNWWISPGSRPACCASAGRSPLRGCSRPRSRSTWKAPSAASRRHWRPSPETGATDEPANAEAYLDKMIRLMRADGVRFPDNKVLEVHPAGAVGAQRAPRGRRVG